MPDEWQSTRVGYEPVQLVAHGRLADARLTHEYDQCPVTCRSSMEGGVELSQLALAANERRPVLSQRLLGGLVGSLWASVRGHGMCGAL
jgi:hypothetical protein